MNLEHRTLADQHPKSEKLWDIGVFTFKEIARTADLGIDYLKQDIKKYMKKAHIWEPSYKIYKRLDEAVYNMSDVNRVITASFLVSLGTNYAATKIGAAFSDKHQILHNVSYWSELTSYSIISATLFFRAKMKEGYGFWDSAFKLGKFGLMQAVASYMVYKPVRAWASDEFMSQLYWRPETAEFWSQTVAIWPFIGLMDLAGRPLKYLDNNKHRIKKKIKSMAVTSHKQIVNGVKTINNGINSSYQKMTRKRNPDKE